jgi:hypothetical protein
MATRQQLDYKTVLALRWPAFNAWLQRATESDLVELLTAEQRNQCRLRILLRIHGRFNKLRAARERKELATTKGMR